MEERPGTGTFSARGALQSGHQTGRGGWIRQSALKAEIPAESHGGGSRDTGPQLVKCCHMSSARDRDLALRTSTLRQKYSPPHSLVAAAHYRNTSLYAHQLRKGLPGMIKQTKKYSIGLKIKSHIHKLQISHCMCNVSTIEQMSIWGFSAPRKPLIPVYVQYFLSPSQPVLESFLNRSPPCKVELEWSHTIFHIKNYLLQQRKLSFALKWLPANHPRHCRIQALLTLNKTLGLGKGPHMLHSCKEAQ